MRKGFFEIDFALAALAVVVMAALMLQAIEFNLGRGADSKKVLALEENALKASQFLVGRCGFDASACRRVFEQLNSSARTVYLEELGEEKTNPVGGNFESVVCIRRLGVVGGREVVAEVCSR